MKFNELSIGQRFELDGAIYIKTSPVLASPEIGGAAKFMARYVAVKPLGGERRPATAQDTRMIPAAEVREALDLHHEACRLALARLEGEVPGAVLGEALAALEAARADFLAAIARDKPVPG